jgi:diadenosine tetraphosphate (Ap4A) HIT family hydrolase
MGCMICERIRLIRDGVNPYFVTELETGFVVLGDHQYFHGYTLFLCKEHKSELFQLPQPFLQKHLQEMSLTAQAVYEAFHPEKMNYELLGNGDSHIHWHLFPRNPGDMKKRGPVWLLEPEIMYDDAYRPDNKTLQNMAGLLREQLDQLRTR